MTDLILLLVVFGPMIPTGMYGLHVQGIIDKRSRRDAYGLDPNPRHVNWSELDDLATFAAIGAALWPVALPALIWLHAQYRKGVAHG